MKKIEKHSPPALAPWRKICYYYYYYLFIYTWYEMLQINEGSFSAEIKKQEEML